MRETTSYSPCHVVRNPFDKILRYVSDWNLSRCVAKFSGQSTFLVTRVRRLPQRRASDVRDRCGIRGSRTHPGSENHEAEKEPQCVMELVIDVAWLQSFQDGPNAWFDGGTEDRQHAGCGRSGSRRMTWGRCSGGSVHVRGFWWKSCELGLRILDVRSRCTRSNASESKVGTNLTVSGFDVKCTHRGQHVSQGQTIA